MPKRGLAACALALTAATFAGPAAVAQSGFGYQFVENDVTIDVHGGSNYVLYGAIGDHDIRFYDGAGNQVGFGHNCGPEEGKVPVDAVTGRIILYSTGGSIECGETTSPARVVTPFSVWVYIDDLNPLWL